MLCFSSSGRVRPDHTESSTTPRGVTKYNVWCFCSLSGVFVLEQGFGLLFADDGGFDLRWIHVHVQFATYQQTHCRRKFSLCFQHLRRLLFDDEGTADKTHTHMYLLYIHIHKTYCIYIKNMCITVLLLG